MLYLVATPIGNLKDISLRALEVLREVDIIAAEDTRHTSKLLMHYDISKPLISYHEHNEDTQAKKIVELLKDGKTIALVSDAGTPGISDPGEKLVKLLIDEGLEYRLIPGPNAAIMGLVLSGFVARSFVYEGFLPQDKKKRRQVLYLLEKEERTSIFYEAPHKLLTTLKDMKDYVKDREICLCRELTKIHEEIKRGKIGELIDFYSLNKARGEFVILVEGSKEQDDYKPTDDEIVLMIDEKIKDGINRKQAIKDLATEKGLSRNELYRTYEENKQ